MTRHYYIQEFEVFGDGDRVIWTSEKFTMEEAKLYKRVFEKLAKDKDKDTWFKIVRDYK